MSRTLTYEGKHLFTSSKFSVYIMDETAWFTSNHFSPCFLITLKIHQTRHLLTLLPQPRRHLLTLFFFFFPFRRRGDRTAGGERHLLLCRQPSRSPWSAPCAPARLPRPGARRGPARPLPPGPSRFSPVPPGPSRSLPLLPGPARSSPVSPLPRPPPAPHVRNARAKAARAQPRPQPRAALGPPRAELRRPRGLLRKEILRFPAPGVLLTSPHGSALRLAHALGPQPPPLPPKKLLE